MKTLLSVFGKLLQCSLSAVIATALIIMLMTVQEPKNHVVI